MRGLNTELNKNLKEFLVQWAGEDLIIEEERGIVVIQTGVSRMTGLLALLKNHEKCRFNVLIDLTAVDYPDKKPSGKRFEVIYLLWSTLTMQRVRVKIEAAEGEKVPTVTSLWKGANWPEREVFDLFGIEFAGHPVMERIIMPEDYRGHPLRKDFPLEGKGEDYLIESILIDSTTDTKQD